MAKAAIAKERGVRFDFGRLNRLAAAERAAKMAAALRELSHLSYEKAAAELGRRGFGWVSYATIRRARARLGISRPAPDKAARKAEPRRRRVAQKAHEDIAATE